LLLVGGERGGVLDCARARTEAAAGGLALCRDEAWVGLLRRRQCPLARLQPQRERACVLARLRAGVLAARMQS